MPLSWSRDHVGPLTRSVSDAAIVLQAIAGYDLEEASSKELPVSNYLAELREKSSSLRVGVVREFFFEDLHPEIATAVTEAIKVLGELTSSVREVSIPVSTSRSILEAEAFAYHSEWLSKTPELYQPFTRERLRAGAAVSTVTYIAALRELIQLRHTASKVVSSVDVLVTPTAPIPPRTIADAKADDPVRSPRPPDLRNTGPFNINGLPSISLPCGYTSNGLPIGLQISGAPGRESVVLQLAHAYEQATEWHKRRPPVASVQ